LAFPGVSFEASETYCYTVTMTFGSFDQHASVRDLPQLRRNVRLDTLVRLRWLAVVGQTGAVLLVHYGLDFTLPLGACLVVIALSILLNIAVRLRFRTAHRIDHEQAAWLLAF